ncbi:hypothetical protein LAWI1_G003256 [Lachnellula willkommii]|uniref:Uncharacterized protein n=1 Tax=Lachnellula willkommii TaxID=215461 RepID=A0A559MES9_9HELO|nr:hypothetical protein LAWI1_G003256 [Lachnellula willkommii]
MRDENEEHNFQLFRECLSTPLIEKSSTAPTKKVRKARAGRKTAIKPVASAATEEADDAAELADFVDVSSKFLYRGFRILIKGILVSGYGNLHKSASRGPDTHVLNMAQYTFSTKPI